MTRGLLCPWERGILITCTRGAEVVLKVDLQWPPEAASQYPLGFPVRANLARTRFGGGGMLGMRRGETFFKEWGKIRNGLKSAVRCV